MTRLAAPVAEGLAYEFGAVVAADQFGRAAAPLDYLFQDVDGLVCAYAAGGGDRERLARALAGDGQQLERAAISVRSTTKSIAHT